jgi:hypothetical protein
MAPNLQRGGCDRLRARRAGCRRRRSNAAQRPSPAGSQPGARYPDDTGPAHRHFTPRVARALIERLTTELRTARAPSPAKGQPSSELQVAVASLPEGDRETALLVAQWEGLTPRDMATPEHRSQRPARGAVAFRQRSAARSSRSLDPLAGREARNHAETGHRVEPIRADATSHSQIPKETKWRTALIPSGSAGSERAC